MYKPHNTQVPLGAESADQTRVVNHRIEFGPEKFGPGESRRISLSMRDVFRGHRLIVASDSRPHFNINGIYVGRDAQAILSAQLYMAQRCTCGVSTMTHTTGDGSVLAHKPTCDSVRSVSRGPWQPLSCPAVIFDESNVIDLALDTAPPGILIGFEVENTRDVPHVFHATLEGTTLKGEAVAIERDARMRFHGSRVLGQLTVERKEARIKFLGPRKVQPGDIAAFRIKMTETDAPYIIHRLDVPPDSEGVRHFSIVSWEVNGETMIPFDGSEILAAAAGEDVCLHVFMRMKFDDECIIRVRNTSDEEQIIIGALVGEWESLPVTCVAFPGSRNAFASLGDPSTEIAPGECAECGLGCPAESFSIEQITVGSTWAPGYEIQDVLIRRPIVSPSGTSSMVRETSIVRERDADGKPIPFPASDIDESQHIRDYNLQRPSRLKLDEDTKLLAKGDEIWIRARNVTQKSRLFIASVDGWVPTTREQK